MIQKVGMIGRGAVGVVYASMLQKAVGKDNFCFLADKERVKRYQEQPVHSNGEVCDFLYVDDSQKFGTVDLLLIVVKGPTLLESLESVRDFVREDTIILSLLNGITSEKIVEETLGKGIVLHAIAQKMDAVKSGEEVTFTKTGEIVIGTNDAKKVAALEELEQFFQENQIPHHRAKDIIHEQWSKLMLNCGINQICAVYDVPYRGCQPEGAYRKLFVDTMEEVRRIANLEGISISEQEVRDWVAAVDALAAEAMPSMRQDVLAKRKTEVDFFSKTIVELAKKHGTTAPFNADLYQKIQEIEASWKR